MNKIYFCDLLSFDMFAHIILAESPILIDTILCDLLPLNSWDLHQYLTNSQQKSEE